MDNADPAPEVPGDGRRAKRKRVALACEPCRDRKVKCDGAKPTCKVCEKRPEPRIPCVYSLVPQTAKQLSEQEYIASLRQQIQHLEQTVRDATSQGARAAVPTHQEARPAALDPITWVEHDPQQQQSGARRVAASPSASSRSPGLQRTDEPSPVSAMGAFVVDREASPRMTGMYGRSSVHSLLQEVSNVSKSRNPRPPAHRSRQIPPSPAAMVGPQYALPPRQVADELLELYFKNVHIFYPYTHSISFQKRYESLWTREGYPGPDSGEPSDIGLGGNRCPPDAFFCALNAMFALGCEFSHMPEAEKASVMFRHRMQDLLQIDFLNCASIASVQALLLAGHYLLTTEHPTRCYNVVGLACRIAVGLSLHSHSQTAHLAMIEQEVRRRVWYACLQLEMTVCMTLGRPPLLQITEDVPLPMAIDDEHLSAESVCEQPRDIVSQNLFMVENLKLAKVLSMILGYIYGADLRTAPGQLSRSTDSLDDNMSALLRLDGVLEDFEASLPEALSWRSDSNVGLSSISTILQRQKNVLRARFLHLRILLYRPSFSLYCSSLRPAEKGNASARASADDDTTARQGKTLSSSIRMRCAMSCVQAACELSKSIELATTNNLTGAWWFGLFYLLTCGGIVILAECAQLSGSYFDQGELDAIWESCIVALRELGKYHSRANIYVQHLRSLRERALSDYVSAHASIMPSRTGSRRPSAEPHGDKQQHEFLNQYGEGIGHTGSEPMLIDPGNATLFDSWEQALDNGGFIFDDDMSAHFPTYVFSSTFQ